MPSVCVFCGSLNSVSDLFLDAARETGRLLAEAGWTAVYGGARNGMMGAFASAALAAGGRVTGVIPRALVDREVAHPGLTELRVVASLQERKTLMLELSDAFLTLPGGFGTLDELFEVLTWSMLGYHDKPCAVLNTRGYYDHLLAFLRQAEAEGFVPPRSRSPLLVAAEPRQALQLLDRQLIETPGRPAHP
ncbi:MAG: TIGR00730 family Rossman fold protein [Bryobacteraceae bacterium]